MSEKCLTDPVKYVHEENVKKPTGGELRPYKEAAPQETIARCREILSALGAPATEVWSARPFPDIFSCTLELHSKLGRFRANGKGRDRDWCLASAYAELIERISNGLGYNLSRTWHQRLHREFRFYADPRERLLRGSEISALPIDVLDDLFPVAYRHRESFLSSYYERLRATGIGGCVGVPYLAWSDRTMEYLPISWMRPATGSNGMAAGNTPAEATYQAVCEILERWCAATVFFDRLTPPDVPRTYLETYPEIELIHAIEDAGFLVTVKDFGLGSGIPALGVILTDKEQTRYRLNVGCDTDFGVTLSRCLTEVVQGLATRGVIERAMLPIPERNYRIITEMDRDLEAMRFARHMRDATGVYPLELFGDDPSYPFRPLSWGRAETYEAECERLVDLIHKRGSEVYVRDVSHLGLPCVHVYVPGVSTVGRGASQGDGAFALAWDGVEDDVFRHQYDGATMAALCDLPMQASINDLCCVTTSGRNGGPTVEDYLSGYGSDLPRCPDCDLCGLVERCLTRGQVELARRTYPKMAEAYGGLG